MEVQVYQCLMHNQCTGTIYFMSGSKMNDKRRSQYNNNNNSMSNSNDATTLLKKAEQRYKKVLELIPPS